MTLSRREAKRVASKEKREHDPSNKSCGTKKRQVASRLMKESSMADSTNAMYLLGPIIIIHRGFPNFSLQ